LLVSRRRETTPISKHTLNLYRGDFEKLADLYPRNGAGKIIRDLVRRHIRRVEQEILDRRTRPAQVGDLNINIEDLFEAEGGTEPSGLPVVVEQL
jgi:hypothetical protein